MQDVRVGLFPPNLLLDDIPESQRDDHSDQPRHPPTRAPLDIRKRLGRSNKRIHHPLDLVQRRSGRFGLSKRRPWKSSGKCKNADSLRSRDFTELYSQPRPVRMKIAGARTSILKTCHRFQRPSVLAPQAAPPAPCARYPVASFLLVPLLFSRLRVRYSGIAFIDNPGPPMRIRFALISRSRLPAGAAGLRLCRELRLLRIAAIAHHRSRHGFLMRPDRRPRSPHRPRHARRSSLPRRSAATVAQRTRRCATVAEPLPGCSLALRTHTRSAALTTQPAATHASIRASPASTLSRPCAALSNP